ncbi:MAG: O-antigen ligase family protein [Gammaproteobacteria bacterium]
MADSTSTVVYDLKSIREKTAQAGYLSVVALGFCIPLSLTGITIGLILTLLFAILGGQIQANWRTLVANPIFWAAFALFVLLFISMSYSIAPWQNKIDALGKYQKLLYLIFLMPLFSQARWQKAGINAFLAAMLVTLAASFLKKLGWLHLGEGGLSTLFTNHINTSFFMAFAAFLSAHRCCAPGKFRWLYSIWLVLTCYQLFFMNEGRTGYFVFIALFGLFFWQKQGWKGLLATLVLVPLLFSVLWISSSHFRERMAMIGTDIHNYQKQKLDDNSVGLRMQFTKHSFELIKYHPWIGTGVGGFREAYHQHFPPDPGFANLNNPQNEFLMIGVQLGLIGLLALAALFYLQWRFSFALAADMQPLAQGMIVAFIVGSWSDTFLYLAFTGYFFVYFTALFYGGNDKAV